MKTPEEIMRRAKSSPSRLEVQYLRVYCYVMAAWCLIQAAYWQFVANVKLVMMWLTGQ